jgi:hypothetical protein
MGILPMSSTGVPPVSLLPSLPLLLSFFRRLRKNRKTTTTGKMPVRLMGGTPMLRRGASTVEYVLLLTLVGLPSLVVFRALLQVMAAYYNMVVFVETLPMP